MEKKKKSSNEFNGKETYIVQIYRKKGGVLIGTVEDVESGEKSTFKAGEELIDRLTGGEEKGPGHEGKKDAPLP